MLRKMVVGSAILLGMALSPMAMAASPSNTDLTLDQLAAQNSSDALKTPEAPISGSLDLGIDNSSNSSSLGMMNMNSMSNMNNMSPNGSSIDMARNMMATTNNMMMQMMNMRNQMWSIGMNGATAIPAATVAAGTTVAFSTPQLTLLITQLANSLNILQGQLNGKATDPAVTAALSQAAILVGKLSLATQGVAISGSQNDSPQLAAQPMQGMNMNSSAQSNQLMPGMNIGTSSQAK